MIASIIIPLGAPSIVAAAIIGFMGAWNEFTFALFLTRSKAETLPLFPVHFLGEIGIDWGTMAAGCAFIMLPALFVIFAMQKAIVKGLTKGAIKSKKEICCRPKLAPFCQDDAVLRSPLQGTALQRC